MAMFVMTPFGDFSKASGKSVHFTQERDPMGRARSCNQGHNGAQGVDSPSVRAPYSHDDLPSPVLLQMKDAIARIETELKHLRRLAEATRKDVDDLKTWKTLVLGGAAVLGILFGLYKAVGSVHVTFGSTNAPTALYVPAVSAKRQTP